jgi:hypothetical protein
LKVGQRGYSDAPTAWVTVVVADCTIGCEWSVGLTNAATTPAITTRQRRVKERLLFFIGLIEGSYRKTAQGLVLVAPSGGIKTAIFQIAL